MSDMTRRPDAASRAISRRGFLQAAGGAGAVAILPSSALSAAGSPDRYPFQLGVASGEPWPDGFVIWTRLAPNPIEGGGMPNQPVAVEWIVARDDKLTQVVKKGTIEAQPALAHSVHVELRGLEPGRPYWYRFRALGAESPLGRGVTMPAPDAFPTLMRFAFTSCQHYEQGLFTAYRHMVGDTPDLVIHLGDYIYEVDNWAKAYRTVRSHDSGETKTLAEYRNRYALYRTDPDLQAAHAWCPWAVTWDDHEVDNDYAADQSEERVPADIFLRRRAAAYQAYYEHMPLRGAARRPGGELRLYRQIAFGRLANFFVLDTRQYRSNQACGEGKHGGGNAITDCKERLDPTRTMLGAAQEAWLAKSLGGSQSAWNVVAQQLVMAQFKRTDKEGRTAFWSDGWDGYAPARQRLLDTIDGRGLKNAITIGGDAHSYWTTDLKADFDNPDSKTVATEFVSTSLSSVGLPYSSVRKVLPQNPHVKYFESRRRGYVLCSMTPKQTITDFRVVDNVRQRSAGIRTLKRFVVEQGEPGAKPA